MLRGSCVDPSWESETSAQMMKLILAEQIPNILVNYRTLKLLHFLAICWDCIHLSIAGYVCVCLHIYIYMCVCVCVCVARARVRGKLEVSQINS